MSRLLMGDGGGGARRVLVPAAFALLTALVGYTVEQSLGRHSPSFHLAYAAIAVLVGWLAFVLMRRQLDLENALEAQTDALRASAERLKRQEDRLRMAIEATGLVLWGWDLESGEMEVGDELRRALGLPRDAHFTLDTYLQYVHPEDRQRLQRTVQQLLRRGGTAQAEYRLVLPDGTHRALLATATVQRNALGEPVQMIGALNDVTERRELEDRLRQSQKMESIGTLAGGIAHDFNNLLTAIMGHGQFAMATIPPDSDVRQEVEAMLIAADRARLLTRQLLAFSRRQILEARLLDLNEVVRDVARLLHRIIGEDIRLELDLAATPLQVHADAGQLTQVLLNFATNARDAMPRGGVFRLSTAAEHVTASAAQRMEVEAGAYAALRVHDTGTGMDASTMARIFDPYFTTKPVGKGTGLGLSMVYGIVRQSNGHVWAESESGRGTTFHVLLPVAPDADS